MKKAFCVALLIALGLSAYEIFSSPDPLKAIYIHTGFYSFGFCVLSVLLAWLKRRVWARRVGLAGLAFGLLHLLNFIILDKYFDIYDILKQISTSPFIQLGLGTFMLLLGAGALSFRTSMRYKKTRSALVYMALALGGIHIFLGVKIPELIEYICLGFGLGACFVKFILILLKNKNRKFKKHQI